MIVSCDSAGIKTAVEAIKNGGTVVFPTDTVYGVGCDPYNVQAIQMIFKLKQRKKTKQLPLLGFSKEEISKIVFFDDSSSKIAEKMWPGPVTLVLKIKDDKIKKTMKLGDKIAVRVPNNKCALALLKECKLIVGTSANISGNPSSLDPEKVMKSFSGYDVFLNGGKLSSPGESTILEMIGSKMEVVRQGIVSQKELADLV